jgi:N,N'-diacetyllegionaminate synthase
MTRDRRREGEDDATRLSTLFLVPARGGSIRVPGKNLRLVGGIPLVGRAIRAALGAASTIGEGEHRVVCSTDDPAIAEAAIAWGAEVLDRPAALATADASSVDVALHALDAIEGESAPGGISFATLVLVQPTSPLVDAADLVRVVERHRAGGGLPVTTVVTGHPAAWHHRLDAAETLAPVAGGPGRDVMLAGACYAISPPELRSTRRFVVPGRTQACEIPAERAVDVDEELDLVVAEAILAARSVRTVPVGDLRIGNGPVFVIAEGGVNHNGDVGLARQLVDAAAAAGADAVKFQTFDPDALVVGGAPTADYQRRAGIASDQREMLRRLALPVAAWAELQARATSQDLVFLSTPFDETSADLLDGLGVPAFKVGSGELTNLPFLRGLAGRGRPLLISTGMADMLEVAAAVDTVRAAGDVPFALLHCVSSYPASPADANLRAIETMRRAFGVPVGWSDHTPGTELALAAVASGATIVEKHLTLDRRMAGPDHASSLEPGPFAAMVHGIREVEAAMGSGIKAPVPAEADVARVARRSLHWRRSIGAGHDVVADDVAILRPADGLAPGRFDEVIGLVTARPVTGGAPVTIDDLADPPEHAR